MGQRALEVDKRVLSAVAIIGRSMVDKILSDGWAPPFFGSLSDDCKELDSVVVESQSINARRFFDTAREILQDGIKKGSSTVFACVSMSLDGKIVSLKSKSNMAAAVMWADRRGWYGTLFLAMPDGELGNLGLTALSKETRKNIYKLFFAGLRWPAVN